MTSSDDGVAVVIPTLDRPARVDTLLRSLEAQTIRPVEVIVVDAGENSAEAVVLGHPRLNARWIRHRPASAAMQRNVGIQAIRTDASLVALVDDDLELETHAFERMLEFWRRAGDDVAGASLNPVSDAHPGHGVLKKSGLAARVGLYRVEVGRVAPSGWQSAVRVVQDDAYVEWLPTAAVWWRRDVLCKHSFDSFFTGYSYLEDLDFSYGVSRTRRLAIVAQAMYENTLPSALRPAFPFGRMEVRNRVYVVRKHGLSMPHCVLGLLIRFGMTLGEAARHVSGRALARAAGNLSGLLGLGPVLDRARKVRIGRTHH